MFNIEKVSNNLNDYDICENVEVNFSKSIEMNSKLNSEIKKVYKRTLNNHAKFILGRFHLNIFNSLESIVVNTGKSDDFILDLTEFIAKYFDKLNYNLNIQNLKEFNEFIYILSLSSIILNSAVKENDMELIYESYYQIKSRFVKEKLIKPNNYFNIQIEVIKTNSYISNNNIEVRNVEL